MESAPPTRAWGLPAQVHRLQSGDKGIVRYLEGDLSQEDELVPLEEPACRVHVHRVGDLVRQVYHALPHLLGGRGLLDGFLKHHVEGLENGQGALGDSAAAAAVPGSFWLILTGVPWGKGRAERPTPTAPLSGSCHLVCSLTLGWPVDLVPWPRALGG